jgi:hypothetical protein
VEPGAVATVDGVEVLDGGAVGKKTDAFDEDHRRANWDAQVVRLTFVCPHSLNRAETIGEEQAMLFQERIE